MHRLVQRFLLLLALTIPVSPVVAQATVKTEAEPLRTAGERPVDVQHIRLGLRVDLPKKTVDAVATLRLKSLRELRHIALDAVGFEVRKVTLANENGPATPARFSHDGKRLVVDLDPAWRTGQSGALRIEYQVREPKEGLHFFGPSKEDPEAPLIVWSQGQPISNRHWFPCLDQPDVRQTTEMVITVAAGLEAISNGRLVARTENPADRTVTFHWLQNQPHPSYLVTLVVGSFEVVREEWDGVPVLYYVPRGERDKVARTFGRTREMIDFFSKRFGVRYPWEKYAQIVAYQFGGGMENTSATTLGDTLVDERSVLDYDAEGLISHELAHQWWGDLVTCRDWAHLWLNEGWASFAECLWEEHARGPDAYAYELYCKSSGAIVGGKERPIVDRRYRHPDTMFDGRAYPKGAWVLHMLRRRLGDDAYWPAVRRYAEEHRLRSVETSDFRRSLERATGRDLERFFYDWTERPGSPVLDVATEYLAEARQARVVVRQTQPGEPFHLPLKVVFDVPGSSPTVIEQVMTDRETTLVVPLSSRPTRIDFDPNHAILGDINEVKSRDLWQAQLLSAPDVVARIRAAKHFGKSKTEADRELLARAFAAEKFWGVRYEMASALGESGGDTCRDILLRGLSDGDARVRRACLDQLGKFGKDAKVVEAVRVLLKRGDRSYRVEGAALRLYAGQGHSDAVALIQPWLSRPSQRDVLRSEALRALGSTGDPAALDLLLEWTRPGHPRTARSAAVQGLQQLTHKTKLNDEQRRRVTEAFAAALASDSSQLAFSTLSAARELAFASDLLPHVEKLGREGPVERVRKFAAETADLIRKKDAGSAAEVSKLREELQRLRGEHEALRERLNRLEKPMPKR